jgi:hypothetical protein
MYVKYNLTEYLSSLLDDLVEMNIPKALLDDILFEGYKNLKKWFVELSENSISDGTGKCSDRITE